MKIRTLLIGVMLLAGCGALLANTVKHAFVQGHAMRDFVAAEYHHYRSEVIARVERCGKVDDTQQCMGEYTSTRHDMLVQALRDYQSASDALAATLTAPEAMTIESIKVAYSATYSAALLSVQLMPSGDTIMFRKLFRKTL